MRCAASATTLYIVGEQGLAAQARPRQRPLRRAASCRTRARCSAWSATSARSLAHGLRGNVVRSTDGGRSWQPCPTGLQVGLTASTLDERGRIVIVSQAGHVLVEHATTAPASPASGRTPDPGRRGGRVPAPAPLVAGRPARRRMHDAALNATKDRHACHRRSAGSRSADAAVTLEQFDPQSGSLLERAGLQQPHGGDAGLRA